MKEIIRIYGSVVITAVVFGALTLLVAGLSIGNMTGLPQIMSGYFRQNLQKETPGDGEALYVCLAKEAITFTVLEDSLLCGQTYRTGELVEAVNAEGSQFPCSIEKVWSMEEAGEKSGEEVGEDAFEFTSGQIYFGVPGVYQCLIGVNSGEDYYVVPFAVNRKG